MCTFAEALERAEARAEARARDEAKAARAEAKVARAEIETNRLETIKSIMSNFKVTIDRAMAVAGVLMTSAMSTGKSWLCPESAAETCFSLGGRITESRLSAFWFVFFSEVKAFSLCRCSLILTDCEARFFRKECLSFLKLMNESGAKSRFLP